LLAEGAKTQRIVSHIVARRLLAEVAKAQRYYAIVSRGERRDAKRCHAENAETQRDFTLRT